MWCGEVVTTGIKMKIYTKVQPGILLILFYLSVSLEDPKNIRGYGGILGYLRALCSYIARQLSSPISSEN